jgi:hypothetical protein
MNDNDPNINRIAGMLNEFADRPGSFVVHDLAKKLYMIGYLDGLRWSEAQIVKTIGRLGMKHETSCCGQEIRVEDNNPGCHTDIRQTRTGE